MTDYIFPEKTMTSHTGLAEFIEEHFDDNTDRLLLGKSKWPDIDMALAVSTILGHRKLRTKVPSWYRNPGLIFPTSLSVEQCSSEFTAEAKVKSFLELLDSEADMRHSQAAASPDKTDTHQTQAEVPLGKDGYSTGTSRKEDNILTGMKIADLTGGLGVDRFYVGDTGLGVAKLLFGWITFGIWPLVDIFLCYRKARKVNFERLMNAIAAPPAYAY